MVGFLTYQVIVITGTVAIFGELTTGAALPKHNKESYVKRPGDRFDDNIPRICLKVICPVGTEIVSCVQNYTQDTCRDCPPNTIMLDNTTSDVDIIRCVALPECSELQHTVASSDYHMCHTGTRTRCHCDIDKGYCGDPCKCSLPKESCKPGEIRLHNCTCVQPRQDPSISVQTTSTIEVPTFRPENFTEATVTTKPDTTTDHELLTPSTTVSDKIMKQQPLDKAKCNSEWLTPGGLAGIIILTVIVTLLGAVAFLNRELIKKKYEGYRNPSGESS